MFLTRLSVGVLGLIASTAVASPSSSPDVAARRGSLKQGKGSTAPVLRLLQPNGGWTAARMIEVAGSCSDTTADPISININGARFFVRSVNGEFKRKFPAARGKNNVVVECSNAAGSARASRTIDARISAVPIKVVLTSDSDGVYTDLHIYEPGGAHVYWADTRSASGGMFFLNEQGESFDQPGYGPYLYVHQAPPVGVYRIDANYWPGGAVAHTLATLDVVVDEGLPSEQRRRVRKPLARPGETVTLAYLWVRGNGETPRVFVPGQDPAAQAPPLPTPTPTPTATGYLSDEDERALRQGVSRLALEQARAPSIAWDPAQRDCAGLVRFVYRETLRPRSASQRKAVGVPADFPWPPLSNSARALLPFYPMIWQVSPAGAGARHGFFADAETLIGSNFRFKSLDPSIGKDGDILVFRRSDGAGDSHHLMLLSGGERGRAPLVVYHNGEQGGRGAVRIAHLETFMNVSESLWRPAASNQNFQGVFEWNRIRPRVRGIAGLGR